MSKELICKIIRCVLIGSIFLIIIPLQGYLSGREGQNIILMLLVISVFSLILDNIWVSLFLCWTVFLYSFFKFETGGAYLTGIFLGCLIYYIMKRSFKKEHINYFINGVLWFVFLNIVYMAMQVSGFDVIFYKLRLIEGLKLYFDNVVPSGLMGQISLMGCLMAMAVPLLATRGSKWAIIGSLGLFLPLYLSKASLCLIMGIVGLLFVFYYRMPKRVWYIIVIALVLSGSMYIKYVDRPGFERLRVWKSALRDGLKHPITGWGLDSFANITSYKNFKYSNVAINFNPKDMRDLRGIYESKDAMLEARDSIEKYANKRIQYFEWWGNPHNLYISLGFEFGIIGLIIFGGYMRDTILRFKNCIKDSNTLALAGLILVFLGVSFGHFPIFLARFSIIVIGGFSLFEVATS